MTEGRQSLAQSLHECEEVQLVTIMPRRSRKYVSPATTPSKRRKKGEDIKQAKKQQSIGLLEAKMAPVLPMSYLESANNAGYLSRPNWTAMQAAQEGGVNTTNWWDQANAEGSAFLQPTDGQCGLLSYRANLGTEKLTNFYDRDQSHAYQRLCERAWSTLALPRSMISGKHTYLKNLHLYMNVKYLTPAPYEVESLPGASDATFKKQKAVRIPPPARVRVLVVKVKRESMGLPMYDLNEAISGFNKTVTEVTAEDADKRHRLDYASKNDNPVSSNLFLDPLGHPFGVDQLTQKEPVNEAGIGELLATTNICASDSGYNSRRLVKKNQPAWMHFSQPVQKKFFEVLSSDTFMLQPDFSQANSGIAIANMEGQANPIYNTSPNYNSCKYMKLTIPINERVEYTPWVVPDGPTNIPMPYGDTSMVKKNFDLMVPKDKAFFDIKVIAMAYCPSDTQEEWHQRLEGFLRGPGAAVPDVSTETGVGMSFSSCPCITLNHYGVLETLDNE